MSKNTIPTPGKAPTGRIVQSYRYLDQERDLLFEVCRFDPEGRHPRRPLGPGAWSFDMKDFPRILYRLPELNYSVGSVYFATNEETCNALWSFGKPATCISPGGGGFIGQDRDWNLGKPLNGKSVIILPDNDEPGRKHAIEVARALYGRAYSVKILELPGLPEKGNVLNFVEGRGWPIAFAMMEYFASQTKPWEPPKSFQTAADLLNTSFEQEPPVIGHGLLPAGGGLILAGDAGTGKSLIRLELAIHLALGQDLWGLKIPQARRVLILQFENAPEIEKARLDLMVRGLSLDGPPTGLLFSKTPQRIDLYRDPAQNNLVDLIQESRAEVVIYDPLVTIHSANENDNRQMRTVMDALTGVSRRTNSTPIVIHHFRKPGQNNEAMNPYLMRGAISLRDWADTQCTLTRKPSETRTLRLLEFHKVRNGPEHLPLLLQRNDFFLHIPLHEDALADSGQLYDILFELGGIVETQKELRTAIREKIGCSDHTARRLLNRAVTDRTILRVRSGREVRYELPQKNSCAPHTVNASPQPIL